jgi:hypothetical protein
MIELLQPYEQSSKLKFGGLAGGVFNKIRLRYYEASKFSKQAK